MNSLGIIYRQLNTSTNESFLELFSGTGKEKGQILARNFQNGTFSARIINLGQLGRTKYTLNKWDKKNHGNCYNCPLKLENVHFEYLHFGVDQRTNNTN